jgi:hypothetical protein
VALPQPVGHEVFRLRQRQTVQGLRDRHGELQHRIEGGAPALAAVAAAECCGQIGADQFDIGGGGELLQRVALRRKLTQPILDVPEPALAR